MLPETTMGRGYDIFGSISTVTDPNPEQSAYRKEKRFAWWPRRLSNGSVIWLKPYWVRVLA